MQIYDLDDHPAAQDAASNLDAWLGKAVEHAEARTFDPEVLLATRLVPDMYSLTRQIQAACDQAKLPAARLAGKTPPVHPDTETTLAELRARIASVVEYLEHLRAGRLRRGRGQGWSSCRSATAGRSAATTT